MINLALKLEGRHCTQNTMNKQTKRWRNSFHLISLDVVDFESLCKLNLSSIYVMLLRGDSRGTPQSRENVFFYFSSSVGCIGTVFPVLFSPTPFVHLFPLRNSVPHPRPAAIVVHYTEAWPRRYLSRFKLCLNTPSSGNYRISRNKLYRAFDFIVIPVFTAFWTLAKSLFVYAQKSPPRLLRFSWISTLLLADGRSRFSASLSLSLDNGTHFQSLPWLRFLAFQIDFLYLLELDTPKLPRFTAPQVATARFHSDSRFRPLDTLRSCFNYRGLKSSIANHRFRVRASRIRNHFLIRIFWFLHGLITESAY